MLSSIFLKPPFGLLVHKATDQHRASWKVFLSLRLSSPPADLSPHLLDLNTVICLINICRDLLCVKVLRGNSKEREQASW